ncbi:uncharacterized protein EV154DRAFT_565915 [Mucor mucedo]|uniref:uncharacterized protein n=1 Tax=Mucor mucedo TaxID=29922 RepID=UPI002220876F|nr:uncharacterized protein EV154DRAFT_565915 [Mucor mucedo]KAI7888883.1 hypothetical protein EV154DRAFT_565915 [Mucor mucedo]
MENSPILHLEFKNRWGCSYLPMNNTEANNNTPKNVPGCRRGFGNRRHNTIPVNNSNYQDENNNIDVEYDNRPSRPYNYANTDAIMAFLANVTHLSMHRKWKNIETRFTRARKATRETEVGVTVPNVRYYKEIANITQDDSSIQPEVIYQRVHIEKNGIQSYRITNDVHLMDAIGSDGPETTYLTPTDVDRIDIQNHIQQQHLHHHQHLYPHYHLHLHPHHNQHQYQQPNTNTNTTTNTNISIRSTTIMDRRYISTSIYIRNTSTYIFIYTTSTSTNIRTTTTTTYILTILPPPLPTSAPTPLRVTRTSKNNRKSGEQSLSTIDPIDAARQLSEKHMAHARELRVEIKDRMTAVQREEKEQRIRDLDNILERVSRNRQTALEHIREADLEEDRRKRMSDMETIMNRFAAIRRGHINLLKQSKCCRIWV